MDKAILPGNVKLKRAYERPAVEDGKRILVDRLWPRGIKKADAAIDLWRWRTVAHDKQGAGERRASDPPVRRPA
jgi:hypothetical protein